MRIGLFYQIQVPKPWTPSSESQRIHEALEQIPYAEQQGFESVWFSEHHFRPVWSHNSAPDLTLAAVSQRTSKIRLGLVWSWRRSTTRCTSPRAWRRSIF
jgi:alkanesulfonate monooxygenase SsuD/methylene tetrahydromethanopterin reductase-like flavin-dependent oxidoreductase (luciferase family)